MQKETYPCSLRTAARETLSHAHRGSNSECRTTPWGGHAHVCAPATRCASGHRSVTTTDNIGALVLRPVTGQIRSQTFASTKVIGAC